MRPTYIKSDETGNYEKAYDIGPVEFLRLFRDASYVFTDSFHGSAFDNFSKTVLRISTQ